MVGPKYNRNKNQPQESTQIGTRARVNFSPSFFLASRLRLGLVFSANFSSRTGSNFGRGVARAVYRLVSRSVPRRNKSSQVVNTAMFYTEQSTDTMERVLMRGGDKDRGQRPPGRRAAACNTARLA